VKNEDLAPVRAGLRLGFVPDPATLHGRASPETNSLKPGAPLYGTGKAVS
jgi:hypothetical protein